MGSQVDVIMGKLNRFSRKKIIALALDIHGELVENTPVDTGWAQTNWLPSVGMPKTDTGSPDLSEITGWTISDGPIYITNNVPYIKKLNGGSSKQAPAGFAEKSVKVAVNRANRRK